MKNVRSDASYFVHSDQGPVIGERFFDLNQAKRVAFDHIVAGEKSVYVRTLRHGEPTTRWRYAGDHWEPF